MLTGISVQLLRGFTDIDLPLYIQYLYGYTFPGLILLVLLAFFIHSIVSNKFLGHVLMIGYYIIQIALFALDINHNLAYYGRSPEITYSGMNGFGHWLFPWAVFTSFWGTIGRYLFDFSGFNLPTGYRKQLPSPLATVCPPVSPLARTLVSANFDGCVHVCGGFIFYNTNVLNEYRSPKSEQALRADYEKKYKKYENTAQPKVIHVNVNADIYPDTRQADLTGTMWLKNKSNQPIDSVHLQLPNTAIIQQLDFAGGATVVMEDKPLGYYIYQLAKPLQAQDSILLNFDVHYGEKGFPNGGGSSDITFNGTFFNSTYLPSFGYQVAGELTEDDERKDNGLEIKTTLHAPPTNSLARMRNYITADADWITFEATLSTVPSQIAIAPGYLQREWTDNGRRYFHYKMDRQFSTFTPS